ncbi:MAG: hypothetical protein LJE74_06170 [Proteobacteria bacterium]|nr:hypothetical protein [Pseudomonadota bacterium]
MTPKFFNIRYHLSLCVVMLALWLGSGACLAATDDENLSSQINYAYANYLGTGVYATKDRSVQVYHLPFSATLRQAEPRKSGIVLRLPVTLGFTNFETLDIVETGLPDSVGTFTFVPGLELVKQVTPIWQLSPFLDSGIGYDLSTHLYSYVYGVGIKSELTLDYQYHQFTLFNELLYAGNTTPDESGNNDFSRLETGLNFQFPLHSRIWDRKNYLSVYYVNYMYFNDLTFLKFDNTEFNISMQNEVGLTFDTAPDMKVSFVEFSRFGLGYQFGNGINVVRLVFGAPF